jgi:hypothetical protein
VQAATTVAFLICSDTRTILHRWPTASWTPRLTRQANAAAIDAGLSTPPRLLVEQVAEQVIADCGGDPRAAVGELVAIVGVLLEENRALAEAASPGYARGLLRR